MKSIFASILAIGAASNPTVYMFLEPSIPSLMQSGAVGWVVPLIGVDGYSGPVVWVSTATGNGIVGIGPGDPMLPPNAVVRLSMDTSGQIAIQFLSAESVLANLGEWNAIPESENWDLEFDLFVDGQKPELDIDIYRLDLTRDDIQVDFLMLAYFMHTLPQGTVLELDFRLYIACSELEKRNGVASTIVVGGVPIAVREVISSTAELTDLREKGWCATNIKFSFDMNVIGKAVLEQYDLVLDANNERIQILPRSSFAPNRPLVRYRQERDQNEQTSNSWRWIEATGPVSREDFILTNFEPSSPAFDMLCLVGACGERVVPSRWHKWIGRPQLTIGEQSISVSEQFDWEAFQFRLLQNWQTFRIDILKIGFRMKQDVHASKDGMRSELYPVTGHREVGEFAVPVWPPFEGVTLLLSTVPNPGSYDGILTTAKSR